jgi:hypothetical protein
MTYAVINCINGTYSVFAEGLNLQNAKYQFHDRCRILWNAPDVARAEVMIVDEQLDCPEGYKEFIHHDVVVAPEPEE